MTVWRLYLDHRLPLEEPEPPSSRTLAKSHDDIVSVLAEYTAHTHTHHILFLCLQTLCMGGIWIWTSGVKFPQVEAGDHLRKF